MQAWGGQKNGHFFTDKSQKKDLPELLLTKSQLSSIIATGSLKNKGRKGIWFRPKKNGLFKFNDVSEGRMLDF